MSAIVPLNHYLTESPSKLFANLTFKARVYNALSKISQVAFLAIVGVVLTISYSTSIAGTSSLLLVSLALATPFLIQGSTYFYAKAHGLYKLAEIEKETVKELRKIRKWGDDEIQEFFEREEMQIPADVDLIKLLPLIARYELFKKKALKIETAAQRDLGAKFEEIRRFKARQQMELDHWHTGHKNHEYVAMPMMAYAAVLRTILEKPTLSSLDMKGYKIPRVGECVPTVKEARSWGHGDYFHYIPRLKRPPILLDLLEQSMTPKAFQELILNPVAERLK